MVGLSSGQLYRVCNHCYKTKRDVESASFEEEPVMALEERGSCSAKNTALVGSLWKQPVNFCKFWVMAYVDSSLDLLFTILTSPSQSSFPHPMD